MDFSRISVLYVDDDPALLDIGKRFLEKTGPFFVDTALSTQVALEKIKTIHFDAVVSDYQMPEISGIELLTLIRKEYPSLPFIIFTGKGREEIAIEAFEKGADFYLQKGGEPRAQFAELAHKIQSAVDHRKADARVIILNRLYNVVSATNKAIVRIREKNRLLEEICRVIVDIGGFRMAWAGFADTEAHTIVPVASHGHIEGYLDTIAISTEAVARGLGPTGTAFREGTFIFSNDLEIDPRMKPWREEAMKRGYRALAAFPFGMQSRNAGVITVYAPQPGFFDVQIVQLLQGMADDITFALGTIDDEVRRKAAEDTLRESEIRFRSLIQNSSDIIRVLDANGIIIYDSPSSEKILGYPYGTFIGKDPVDFVHPEDRARFSDGISQVYAGTNPGIPTEFRVRRADGEYIFVEAIAVNLLTTPGVHGVVTTTRPVTERKQAERALIESEEKYRQIVETAQEGIVAVDAGMHITFANKRMEEIIGLSVAEIIGRRITEFVSPEEIHHHEAEVILRRQGISSTYERRLRDSRGNDVWCFVSSSPLTGKDGSYSGSFAMLIDITERKNIENALKEREETYRNLVERANDGITIVQDQVLKYCNPRLAAMWGGSISEILGRPFTDFVHPDVVPGMVDQYRRRMAGEQSDLFVTTALLRKDGSLLFAELNGCLVTYHGAAADMVIVRDVTERRSAEIALKESESQYRNVVEDQSEFICRFTPDGVHVFVNDAYCRYFGKKREEIIGHRFIPSIPEEERSMVREHFASLTREIPTSTVEHRIVMDDGRIRCQRWSDRAIFDEQGRLVEFQSVGCDITEKKEADAALHLANMKLNLLNSITRHDILNKLTVLLGYTELIKSNTGEQTLLSYAQRIEDAAGIIREQIDFTRDYQDLGIKSPVWQNIGEVVRRAVAGLHMDDLALTIQDAKWEIFADPLLEKVFYNLIENSIKHGKTATKMEVYTNHSGKTLIIFISDNGSGVPDYEKEKIFLQGYGKTTGLGLFLVREILSITGMTISETGSPGNGARFEISVPMGAYRPGISE